MLRRLHVEDLALIENLDWNPSSGFTCLTGETGAGKSLLLDAVGLLLGRRANVDMIRSGSDRLFVEGLFSLAGSRAADVVVALLAEQGIACEDGELVIWREVNSSGKTAARVNGRLVTAQLLRAVGQWLVHQHGQHDSMLLMRKEEHLALLDAFGGDEVDAARRVYQELYDLHGAAKKELSVALQDKKDRMQRLDVLTFQLREMEEARLREGEEVHLGRLRDRWQHAERLYSVTRDAYEQLYDGQPRCPSVLAVLAELKSAVSSAVAHDAELNELLEYLDVAEVHLSEAADFARRYKELLEFDPEKLKRLEDRLAVLDRLFGKYGASSHEVLAYMAEAAAERDRLVHYDETVVSLRQRLDEAAERLRAAAGSLRHKRRSAAQVMERELQAELERLHMPSVQLFLRVNPVAPGPSGADEAELLFSANRGEEPRPLARIASGGELSRIMLAVVQVLAGRNPVDTMVFDEIDAGISGRAAQAVADRVAHIARHHQVLCVTHLPQMACRAAEHMLIEKSVDQGRTATRIRTLSAEDRVEELAKMMGGERVTDTTRQQAREMLGAAQTG